MDMADKPENNLPKVPPFHIPGASNQHAEEPVSKSAHMVGASKPISNRNNHYPSPRGMLSVLILLVSILSLGIAMAGAAWVAIDVFTKGLDNQVGVFPKLIAVGLAYIIGWIVSIFGVRVLGHLTLPFVIKAFAWITIIGICGLQIAIISKLFNQSYSNLKFIIYLLMMGIGLLALIGFHLIVENHNLVPFSFPVLAVSLVHLIVIVSHYVFADLPADKYVYFWSDAFFFLFTSTVGVLMLAHFGLLNGVRRFIDRKFNPKDNQFVPPN
jgi:hypothetical protein